MGVDYREQYKPEHLEPFFPHENIKMVIVVLTTLAILMFLVVLPTLLQGLGFEGIFHKQDPADPGVTPPHIRPEWYFLSVYQYLKLMPAQIFGINGKAMGIFTSGLVMLMVLLLPFWFPLRRLTLRQKEWGRGLKYFAIMLGLFLISAVVMGFVRIALPEGYRDFLHPMYLWPILAICAFTVMGMLARGVGFKTGFRWLRLYSTGLWLVLLQFFIFVVILGQGLSWGIPAALAYVVSMLLFLICTGLIIGFMILRIRGADEALRPILLTAFVTEGVLLLLGTTIWAMWPAGGLYRPGEGWHHETGGLIFFLLIIATATITFYTFLMTERRTIRKVMKPEERDKIE